MAEDKPAGLVQSGLSYLKGFLLGEGEEERAYQERSYPQDYHLFPSYPRGEPQPSEMDSIW